MKYCIKCEQERNESEYYKNNQTKDGLTTYCKVCLKISGKEYHHKNKEKILTYKKQFRLDNIEKFKLKDKIYSENNREAIRERMKGYCERRRKSDVLYRLKKNVQSAIKNGFRYVVESKNLRSYEILGCSIEEFKEFIESKFEPWMNWDNRGLFNGELNYGWDLDHIIPQSTAVTEEDVIKLNHYTNFQPLCSYVNRYVKKDRTDYTRYN